MEKSAKGKPLSAQFGKRHIQAILMFFCITIEFASRNILNVAIVSMTDPDASSNPDVPTYDWDDTNIILSSFSWGYIILQVLAGQMGISHGYKWVVCAAMGVNSVASCLIPFLAAQWGSAGVMGTRVVQGMAQGFFFPIAHIMIGKWAPENERSRMTTFVYIGVGVGGVISGPITGYLSGSSWGWPSVFYVFGAMGLLWCLAWSWAGYDSPATHPTISLSERKYIEESLGQHEDKGSIPTPWKAIFTSIHYWAVVVAFLGSAYGNIFITTETSQYLVNVMNLSVEWNGLVNALPYIAAIVTLPLYGYASDKIIERQWLTRVNARRFFQLYGSYVQAIVLAWMAFLNESQVALAIVLPIIGNAAICGILYGSDVNLIDLSPRFAGVTHGFSNTLSSAIAMLAPIVVQYTVTDMSDPTQWRIPFLVASLGYAVTSTFFGFFASGDRQWWDAGSKDQSETTDKPVEIIDLENVI